MRGESGTPDPILCAHLIRRVDEKLIDLLSSLTSSEWDVQTIVPRWKVRDVAAHLLDTALRKLSMARDSCYVEGVDIRSPQDLVTLVDRLNQQGVTVYRRLSPSLLIDLMRVACEQSARFHEALDPFAPARFAVSWAGEETSLNWFDTARELTERWHHQQQIRLATNRPGIMTPDLYHPVVECFVRGLPHVYRNVRGPDGSSTLSLWAQGERGGAPRQRRSSIVLNTGTSVRKVASVRNRSACSQPSKSTVANEEEWRMEGRHSLQCLGMSSRCGYTDRIEAAAFFPQPGIPGNPSALSPTRAR